MNIVNRILNRKTETRFLAQPITFIPATPAQPAWANDIPTMGAWNVALPQQVQGDDKQNRIGDTINPTDLRVKVKVRFAMVNTAGPEQPPAYVQTSLPLDLTVYIVYGTIKSLKTYQGSTNVLNNCRIVQGSTEASTALSRLLDHGDGSFGQFTGDPAYAQYPLSDYVNMKVKKIRLHKPAGWVNTQSGAIITSPETSSDGIHEREVVLKFKTCPGKFKYRNSTDVYPDNYAPVFAVGYCFNDAASNPAAVPAGFGTIEYCAISMLRYKDFE